MSETKFVKEYKCLSCGAGLAFNPASQKWDCDYCFSSFSKEELDAAFTVEEPGEDNEPELSSYRCASCGAELIADDTTSATFCLYCKNPTVIKSRFSGKFRPHLLIPFKLTKEQAKAIYRAWIKRRLFAPADFKRDEEIDKITGIYAPFWLFNCNANGVLEGEATKVRSWTLGDTRYTETKYYQVTRAGCAGYAKIPVDASKKLDNELMHMIEPYQYQDMTDFSMQYMSGFMAERYDVEAEEASGIMEGRVQDYMAQSLRSAIYGYSSFHEHSKNVELSGKMQDYAMLPIYLLMEKYKDKEHFFIVNGQTGKIVGQTPLSKGRMLAFAAALFAGTWLLAVLGGALFV